MPPASLPLISLSPFSFSISLCFSLSLHTKTHFHHGEVSLYPTDQGLRVQEVRSFSQGYQNVAKSLLPVTPHLCSRHSINNALLSPARFTSMRLWLWTFVLTSPSALPLTHLPLILLTKAFGANSCLYIFCNCFIVVKAFNMKFHTTFKCIM